MTSKYTNAVIAAVLTPEKLHEAVKSPCKTIFLLTGTPFNLSELVNTIRQTGKKVHVGLDLIEGFARDSVFLEYLAQEIKPDGIITTKPNLIKTAKKLNLFAIQRIFIFDSRSLSSGIDSVLNIKPDAVEVLPGIMPKIIKKVKLTTNVPVISGGLLADIEDIDCALDAGAVAVSTSNPDFWNLC